MSEPTATFLTQENITLALSIFGSIGTLITFISSYLTKRKNLKINIISSTYNRNLGRLILIVTFENRSRLPISVTSTSVIINGNEHKLLQHPYCVGEYTQKHGNDVVDRKFEYNLRLPADIQQLSAVSGYLLFDVAPKEFENLSTPLILPVHSTQGLVQKIELLPDQIEWI